MLTYTLEEDVAIISLDDGKANAMSYEFLEKMHEALDRALTEAKAIMIEGRPGKFCAGFDLSIMQGENAAEEATKLVHNGGKVMLRLFECPLPLVMACTGHALAGGALMLLCGDTRIGAQGEFKLGLNETAIGMVLPAFALALTKARVNPMHWTQSYIQSRIYAPHEAVDAGYLDMVVEADHVHDTALAAAKKLTKISGVPYEKNKIAIRKPFIDAMEYGLK